MSKFYDGPIADENMHREIPIQFEDSDMLLCPFCGGKPKAHLIAHGDYGPPTAQIRCTICEAVGGGESRFWNRGCMLEREGDLERAKRADKTVLDGWNRREHKTL